MIRLLGAAALAGFLLFCATLRAGQEFEVFDGQVYNKKYYPRIDIIEWGTPSHMEFHVYWKGHPLDMAFQLEKKQGKTVMLVKYYIKERDETLCRRVLAPSHFQENMFLVYKDTSDADMDRTIVTMDKLPAKKGLTLVDAPIKYAACEEPKEEGRAVAETTENTKDLPKIEFKKAAELPAAAQAAPRSATTGEDAPAQVRPKSGSGAIKSKGSEVPFGNL